MTNFLAVTGIDADAEPQLLCFALQEEETQEPLNTTLINDLTEAIEGANPQTREDSTEFIFDSRERYDVLREQICGALETAGHRLSFHLGEIALSGEESVFKQLYS